MDWTPHVDGYICGEVGVFPFWCGAWEVWVKVDGEWQEYKALEPFATIDEAKEAAAAVSRC